MAQNVTIAGASYSDVPAIEVPKTGGGTAVFYDETVLDSKLTCHPLSNYDCNACVDEGLYLVGSVGSATASNCPSGNQFGSLFVMPYRKATGNTTTDYCTQIFIPNGDDGTYPNSMFFRTSLDNTWNAWQRVITASDVYTGE